MYFYYVYNVDYGKVTVIYSILLQLLVNMCKLYRYSKVKILLHNIYNIVISNIPT